MSTKVYLHTSYQLHDENNATINELHPGEVACHLGAIGQSKTVRVMAQASSVSICLSSQHCLLEKDQLLTQTCR